LPKFVLYWTSLAVASWVWSIIWKDNRLKPHSTGFRKFYLLLFLLFFNSIVNRLIAYPSLSMV
jgi:hypothetical protein